MARIISTQSQLPYPIFVSSTPTPPHPFRYGLELHIVSHERRFANFSEAIKYKNGIAVVAVLFQVTDQHNPTLKNVLDSFHPVREQVGKSSMLKKAFSPDQLMPENVHQFFRYEGSLTTPGCNEAVMWTVLTSPLSMEMSQIVRFKETKDLDGQTMTHNFRTLQRLNSRPLIYVHGAPIDDGSTAANGWMVASVGLLLMGQMVSMLGSRL